MTSPFTKLPKNLAPNIDTTLHEYWVECHLYRDGAITQDQFLWCMHANCNSAAIPEATRQKILKYTLAAAG